VHDRAELGRQLCERIARGELVSRVCADLKLDVSTPWRWGEDDEEFRKAYARARELQAHAVAEQAIEAAHGMDDYAEAVELVLEREEATLEDMEPRERMAHQSFLNSLRHSAVQRDKLRVDTLKWTAAKLAPRHYSDRQQVEHATPDGKPFAFTLRIDSPKDDDSAG
jgi:hypothetical protein